MSKKNRHKSRPQRPSMPTKPSFAVDAVSASAAAAVDEPGSADGAAVLQAQDVEPIESSAGAHATPDAGQPVAVNTPDPVGEPPSGADDGHPQATTPAAPPAAIVEAPAPLSFAPPTPAPMASHGDIRGVLIQVAGARLLLPNATIAEVLSYADPEPVGDDAPAWLLGRLRWRGWQVPLIAFGTLAGVAQERAALGSKVVVLKALAGTARTPYFAMLTQGFPRLVTVSRQTLSVEDDSAETMPRGVQARVRLNDDPALLPDLEAIEALVADAVAHAA